MRVRPSEASTAAGDNDFPALLAIESLSQVREPNFPGTLPLIVVAATSLRQTGRRASSDMIWRTY